MKKKIISIVIVIGLALAFILSNILTYAHNAETALCVGLSATDTSGVGYAAGSPTNKGEYIWNLLTYNPSNKSELSVPQRNLYCVKANYGSSWSWGNPETISQNKIDYNLYYDMQADRADLLANIVDKVDEDGNIIENTAHDLVRDLLNPDGSQYKQLLWLLDNAYIVGKTDKTSYLEKVGIVADEYDNNITYENKNTGTIYGEDILTDADIIAVQRMAIWYFTNGEDFGKTEENQTQWLHIIEKEDTEYKTLSKKSQSRNDMANDLYRYLIAQAQDATNLAQYTEANNYTPSYETPAVDTTGLTQIDGTKYQIETNSVGSNYVIGPIVIKQNNSESYDLAIKVTDKGGNEIGETQYKITDKTGNQLSYTNIKELVGLADGFYISIPRTLAQQINVKIDITPATITKKLWLVGTETTKNTDTGTKTEIELKSEQPLVEITKETITTELISKPAVFDLALRKYITAVDGIPVPEANTRVPDITLDTLKEGTTATYKHRKDPVVVEENAEVTYKITIYNEGQKSGYASKIIDQLPTGLIKSTKNSTTTVVSKDKNGYDKNTYKVSYSAATNQIILEIIETTENTIQSLNPYTEGNLDFETIEINCTVIEKANRTTQTILTNVAWIDEAYDSDAQQQILTEGQDRDSEPQDSPNVTQGYMEKYKGDTSNPDQLDNSEYYYKGQEDDDDFEKLVLKPVELFDLELVKFIAAISKDAKIDEGEYLTDTKNSNGIYQRAPKITIVKEQDSEKRRIHCDWSPSNKIPVLVEEGDYVLYTIRVYNAGEIDGYAAEIKDHLPLGLEFVETTDYTAEYYGIWSIDEYVDKNGDKRQILSTTHLAKGKGKELDATEKDENYTANLLKALDVDGEVADGTTRNPDYRDVQVLCKVTKDAQKNGILVNYAQISEDTDENGDDIDDDDSTPNNLPEDGPHEDDEDLEKLKLQCFDLSLRKFITSVNGKAPEDSREPVVDVSNLISRTSSTATYTHPKTPLAVQVGDIVIYTIRVYNEGDIDGFASEVTDYLPPYLTYIKDNEINSKYGWQISEDGRVVTTTYLKDTELKAFDGTKLSYADLKIACMVSDKTPLKQNQTNIAEISEYTYNGKTVPSDIDSTSDNIEDKIPADENLPSYKDEEINEPYVPGNEDDDDFEKIYVKEFDLALRKFITQVQDKEITTRVPQIKNENGTITYEHTKEPITLHVADRVEYTLRIFNEGEMDGYASEITDDIPEYLEYLPEDSTNVEYMWKMYDENGNETENVEAAVKVKTTYLSKENGEDNLIKAFDGTTLYYKDIKIAFKVKDPNSNQYIITNYAQISDDTDENGDEVKDKDSEPDEWNDGEDDQDIENIKVEYFDLSLLKFVSKVIIIEDGKESITETGYNGHENPEPVVKVELYKKKLSEVIVKFGYGITITNESNIAGYATEITDYVPEGLKFVAEDNPDWTDEGNNVISTRQLEGRLLQPGESVTIEVILTWINGADNLSLKTNIAEISEDDNEYDVPDRDSTPDNQKEGEDDIDIAKVILTISTGTAQTYFTLTLGLLAVIATGVILIKKFVI